MPRGKTRQARRPRDLDDAEREDEAGSAFGASSSAPKAVGYEGARPWSSYVVVDNAGREKTPRLVSSSMP
jgi:hypothetical protein